MPEPCYEAADLQSLPDEYTQLLVRLIRLQADGEIAAPQVYLNDWCLRAPTAFDQMMIARIASQELDHYRKFANVLSDIAIDISDLMTVTPEQRKVSALNHRIESWPDLAAFYFLIDRVGAFQGEELTTCSYGPVARVMPKIMQEELTHVAFGALHVKKLADDPRRHEEMQAAIDRWFPRGLDMFGRSHSARAARYVHWGLKRRSNEALRDAWLAEVSELLTEMGLRVPSPDAMREFP